VLTRLDPVATIGLVRDGHDGTLAFSHALVREAALAELDLSSRHALHERAARVTAAIEGDRAAAAVAAHYEAAGDRVLAGQWWQRAGEQAAGSAMYAEACERFEAAVRATEPDVPLDLQLARAESRSRIGDQEHARDDFLAATREEGAAGDTDSLARAALGVGALGGGFEIRVLDVEQIALLEEVLADADASPSARSRIMARLSVALSLDEDHERRIALASEAAGIARSVADDSALVHALAAWCDAHAHAAHTEARLAATDEMLGAAVRSGDPELELLARRFRIVALMESGLVERATAEIRAFARLADSLRQPVFQWYARVVEAMLALLHGDLEAAWELGTAGAELGRRARSDNAQMLAEGGVLAMVLRERGDHDAFLRTILAANSGHPEAARGFDFIFPVFLVGYGIDAETIRDILQRMPRELAWLEHDALYLFVWTHLATAAAFVGDAERYEDAWPRLLPHADRFVLDGTAAVCYGPVSATLARIALARGDLDDARGWFERALDTLSRINAPLLQSRVERELAELGATSVKARRATTIPADAPRFERDGDTWALAFGGDSTRLRDSKGLRDLAVLLARPDAEVHALDLVAASEGHGRTDRAVGADLGPALDARARGQYEQRIRDLTELVQEAEDANDLAHAARLDDERSRLLHELAAALGLSGRARSQSSDAERARKAVTMRIRDAIGRIDRELPGLGTHLRNSVRTGIYCSYRPELPVEWRL
jgi:tetratricopeptide (TPR) repeat protein